MRPPECLVLCLRTGAQEELVVAERDGDTWYHLHQDAPSEVITPERLRSLLRTRTMAAADRWRVPPIPDDAAPAPLSILQASTIVAAVRSGEVAQLDAALDEAGVRSVPVWLTALDGAARGQVSVVRHTSAGIQLLVDLLATGDGWVMIHVDDDVITPSMVSDPALQSFLDAAVRETGVDGEGGGAGDDSEGEGAA